MQWGARQVGRYKGKRDIYAKVKREEGRQVRQGKPGKWKVRQTGVRVRPPLHSAR